jgi:hypothetical protein
MIGAWLNKVEVENSQPSGAIIATRLLALTGMRLGEVLRPLGAVLRKTIFDIYAAMPSSWNTPRMAVRSAS